MMHDKQKREAKILQFVRVLLDMECNILHKLESAGVQMPVTTSYGEKHLWKKGSWRAEREAAAGDTSWLQLKTKARNRVRFKSFLSALTYLPQWHIWHK